MSRIKIGACLVSALALGYAANASTDYQMTVSGTVPGFCKIVTSPINETPRITLFGFGNGGIQFNGSAGATVTYSSFANSDGTAPELGGEGTLHVNSNAQCNYELRSAFGALKNLTHPGALRAYSAKAYEDGQSAPFVTLNSLSDNQLVNSFSISAPTATQTKVVQIDFDIPEATSPLAAGNYQDVLTLKITPQS
jgi:hypothetical protein